MNAAVQQEVSFRIFNGEHKVKKSLIACFLKEREVCKDDYLNLHSFILKTKGAPVQYSVRWDDSVFPDLCELNKGEKLKCIISFQQHTFGNFAVIKKA